MAISCTGGGIKYSHPRLERRNSLMEIILPQSKPTKITYPIPNSYGSTVDVWEWIIIFTPQFIVGEITYPYWDYNQSTLVKAIPRIYSQYVPRIMT